MARLGELLLAAGRITPAQLDEGLRAQVLYGGRLGTNLVELFHLDLDAIALALARQHGVPAALGKHFERCDVTVQARLPYQVAERWSVIPIGRLADRRERIAIASCDPLPADAAADLATFLRCGPDALVVSIAAELRIRYYLERAYGIARPSRYLRVRRETVHEIPVPPPEDFTSSEPDLDVDVDVDLGGDGADSIDQTGTTVMTPTGQIPMRAMPRSDDDEPTISRSFASSSVLDDTPAPPEIEIDPEIAQVLVNEKRRRFVRTLSDGEADISEPAPGEPETPPPPAAPADGTLARIAIRKVSQAIPREAGPELGRLEDATRAIRRAPTRERVGELLVRAAIQIGGAGIDAAVVFVVREPIAIGWKGEVRGGDPALDEIAVPLDEPNAVARAVRRGELERLDVAGGAATELDRRLWVALGGPAPAQIAVAPVVIGGHPVCLLYVHGPGKIDAADLARNLTEAASTAFVRLLRAAQR